MQWTTRPRPHVDRCATAWLVRRFVDPHATFVFAESPPAGATPFDLPGVKYGHHGNDCTFETVLKEHKLGKDKALAGVAALVHDLDMHEMKRDESAGLDAILRGILLAEKDDHKVVERAALVFDALYALEKAKLEA